MQFWKPSSLNSRQMANNPALKIIAWFKVSKPPNLGGFQDVNSIGIFTHGFCIFFTGFARNIFKHLDQVRCDFFLCTNFQTCRYRWPGCVSPKKVLLCRWDISICTIGQLYVHKCAQWAPRFKL